jgi:hypothetical protein
LETLSLAPFGAAFKVQSFIADPNSDQNAEVEKLMAAGRKRDFRPRVEPRQRSGMRASTATLKKCPIAHLGF